MPDFNFGKRVKDLRKRNYGEGVIVGYINELPEQLDDPAFWIIRWDDSGLDNEWLEESEFELIEVAEELRRDVNHAVCRDCPRCGHAECVHETGPCRDRNGCDCPAFVPANDVIILPNGSVAVFGNDGQQIPEFQGSWINFDYLRDLAQTVAKDNPRVTGMRRMVGAAQDSFRLHLGDATKKLGRELYPRECTCNDYPHHGLCGAVQDYPNSEGKSGQ